MKLTVLTWLRDSLIEFTGKSIEIIFRIILCLMPLGVYLLLLQLREKASKVSSLSVYTADESTWQHVFPGFILIAINPNLLKESFYKFRKSTQSWINDNKFLLFFILLLVVSLLTLIVCSTYLLLKTGRVG